MTTTRSPGAIDKTAEPILVTVPQNSREQVAFFMSTLPESM